MKLVKTVKGFQPAPTIALPVQVRLVETWNGKQSTEFIVETDNAASIQYAKSRGFKEV